MQSAWIWGIRVLRWRRAKTARQDSETTDWCSSSLNQAKQQSQRSLLGVWPLFYMNSAFPIYVHECINWHMDQCMGVIMCLEFRIITLLILDDWGRTEKKCAICFFFFLHEIIFDNYLYSLIGRPRSITRARLGEDENGFLHFPVSGFIFKGARLQVSGAFHY